MVDASIPSLCVDCKTQQLFCLWLIFNANEPQRQGSHYDYEVLYNGEAEAGLLQTIDQCILYI